jgi:hypothetical protein
METMASSRKTLPRINTDGTDKVRNAKPCNTEEAGESRRVKAAMQVLRIAIREIYVYPWWGFKKEKSLDKVPSRP